MKRGSERGRLRVEPRAAAFGLKPHKLIFVGQVGSAYTSTILFNSLLQVVEIFCSLCKNLLQLITHLCIVNEVKIVGGICTAHNDFFKWLPAGVGIDHEFSLSSKVFNLSCFEEQNNCWLCLTSSLQLLNQVCMFCDFILAMADFILIQRWVLLVSRS